MHCCKAQARLEMLHGFSLTDVLPWQRAGTLGGLGRTVVEHSHHVSPLPDAAGIHDSGLAVRSALTAAIPSAACIFRVSFVNQVVGRMTGVHHRQRINVISAVRMRYNVIDTACVRRVPRLLSLSCDATSTGQLGSSLVTITACNWVALPNPHTTCIVRLVHVRPQLPCRQQAQADLNLQMCW